jgi:hypothetical protein
MFFAELALGFLPDQLAPKTARRKGYSCDLAALAPFRDAGLDTFAGFGGAMKLKQPREAMPLTVWIAFALMAIGTVVYLTGFVVIEDVLAFFSDRK